MKKALKILGILLVIVLIISGVFINKYGPNFNIYLFPPTVEKYVEVALGRMNNGYYANDSEWEETKSTVYEKTKSLETYEETYEYLEEAVKVAGGKHSFFTGHGEVEDISQDFQLPTINNEGDILYIKLPPILYATEENKQQYITRINNAINKKDYKGIIVDLSDNTGGDMWPMLQGISPLFAEGKFIQFKNVVGSTSDIVLEEDKINSTNNSQEPFNVLKENIPVAIVINNMTASSGEIVAISFKGLENAKFFGEDSAGYTSVNSQIVLYDNAIIQLTTASLIDRTGKEYLNIPINPDNYTEDPIDDAEKWIKEEINL